MSHSINLKDFIESISYNKSQTYNRAEVLEEIAKIELLKIVNTLPTKNIKNNKIYLVLNDGNIEGNKYDLYVYVNNKWEQIDSLEFNIEDYYTSSQVNSLLNGKSDKGHGHDNATPTLDGFMAMEDKDKLDKITASEELPLIDNVTAVTGVSTAYAREDHVHPTVHDDIVSTEEAPKSLDAYKGTGFYKITGVNYLNVDDDLKTKLTDYTYGLLEVKSYSEKSFIQVLYTLKKDVVSEIFYRNSYTNVFSAWERLKPHEHGIINDDGSINSSNAKNKSVATDANGMLITEAKNNHSHGSLGSSGKLSATVTDVNNIVVTDNNNYLKVINILPFGSVVHLSAGNGLSLSDDGTTMNHSNNVQAVTSDGFKKIQYDTEGHITGSSDVVKSDITGFGLTTGDIKDSTAHTNIGSKKNDTQSTINGLINTQLALKANNSDVYKKTETLSTAEIGTAIANGVGNVQLFELKTTLPSTDIKGNKFYLIPNNENIEGNVYDIYIYINNKWEKIDSLELNIEDYYTKDDVDGLLTAKLESVSTNDINNKAVTLAKLNDDVYDTSKSGTVGSKLVATNDSRLSDVRTPKDNSVSTAKIQSKAVTYEKIADSTITLNKINSSDAIDTTPTDNSNKLITSNAVYDGLNTKLDKSQTNYKNKNVIVNSSGNIDFEEKNNHSHGNITSDGKVGTNPDYFVYTTTEGKVTSKEKIGNITTDGKMTVASVTPSSDSFKNVITDASGKITLTPLAHHSKSTLYGQGDDNYYGHVRVKSEIGENPSSEDAVSPSAVKNYVDDKASALEELINDVSDILDGDEENDIPSLEAFIASTLSFISTTEGFMSDYEDHVKDFLKKPLNVIEILTQENDGTYNLNNCEDSGFYYCDDNVTSTLIKNQARDTNKVKFVILVEKFKDSSNKENVKQTLTYTDNGNVYVRVKTGSGSWTNWTTITSTLIDASQGDARNLDDYTIAGFYYCFSNDNRAKYVANTPLNMLGEGETFDKTTYNGSNKNSFYLIVEQSSGGTYAKQTLTYYTQDARTYVRTLSGGTWKDWHEVAWLNDIPPIANNLTTTTTGSTLDATQGKVLKDLIDNKYYMGLVRGSSQQLNTLSKATEIGYYTVYQNGNSSDIISDTPNGIGTNIIRGILEVKEYMSDGSGDHYIQVLYITRDKANTLNVPSIYYRLGTESVETESNGIITWDAQGDTNGWFKIANTNDIPVAETTATNIKMNGTQSEGALSTYARADHVHPSDTSKAEAVHSHPDTQINWNGSSLAGSVSPIDMALYNEFNANRLAYLPGDNITAEYSTDGGVTWIEYDIEASVKSKLVTTSQKFIAGHNATASSNNQLRITINAGGGNNTPSNVYLDTRKLMIYYATAGGSNTKVKIETSTYGTPTTWDTIGTYNISGNEGWNSYPLSIRYGGSASQTTGTRIQNIRLTFTTGSNKNFYISKIRLFGENCWYKPSTLADTGHMYEYDIDKNVTFPAKIIKSGGKSSELLLANGDVKTTTDFATSEHLHSYLPLSGGTLTGNVSHPIASDNANNTATGNIPWAGTLTWDTDIWTTLKNKKDLMGSFTDGSKWWNIISNRHRNGSGDGYKYGMYIRTTLQDNGGLLWAKQKGETSFMDERTILDSSNYSDYSVKKPITIPNGTESEHNDLNNYTTTGFYYYPTNATTSNPTYIDNIPNNTGKAFTLFVEQQTTNVGVKQTLTFYNGNNPQTFIRVSQWNATTTTGWNSWKEVAWTTDIPPIANNLTTTTTGSTLDATQGKVLKTLVDGKADLIDGNILPNSQMFDGGGATGVLTGEYYNNCAIRRFDNTEGTNTINYIYYDMPKLNSFKGGDRYTVSLWAKGSGKLKVYCSGDSNYMGNKALVCSSTGVRSSSNYDSGTVTFTLTNDWQRLYVTYELDPNSTATNIRKSLTLQTTVGSDCYICGVVMERGETLHTEFTQNIAPIDANDYDVEFVQGTHGATETNVWTGKCNTISRLLKGTKIYYMLSSNGNGESVTLNLTMADGYQTGAKYIKNRGSNPLTTQFIKDEIIALVYDGSYWRLTNTYHADNSTLQLSSNLFSIKDNGVTLAKLNSDVYETTPTASSTKLITSGGVYTELNKKSFTQDSNITSNTTGRYAIGTLGSTTIYGKDTTYTPASETPLHSIVDGNKGSSTKYAREDHQHPTLIKTVVVSSNNTSSETPITLEDSDFKVPGVYRIENPQYLDLTNSKTSANETLVLNTTKYPQLYCILLETKALSANYGMQFIYVMRKSSSNDITEDIIYRVYRTNYFGYWKSIATNPSYTNGQLNLG